MVNVIYKKERTIEINSLKYKSFNIIITTVTKQKSNYNETK